MPREDRRIIFYYSEAYKAIYALCVQKELRPPPPGTIRAVTPKSGDDQTFIVKIANSQDGSAFNGEYSRDFLAAALMLYCRTCKIPLPKKALKSMEAGSDSLILRVMI